MWNGYVDKLRHARQLGDDVARPLFRLMGIAIGNGFTDAKAQTEMQAEVAFNMGLIDVHQRGVAEAMQRTVLDLVASHKWRAARAASNILLAYITNASASATLEDVRRNKAYDATARVDAFFNIPSVRAAIGVRANSGAYAVCSDAVDAVMGHDVMKSVAHLVEDILAFRPVLLYQGQWDAECGVAGNEVWINALDWRGRDDFLSARRDIWILDDKPAGYVKYVEVVIRNTGHMVPHDDPLTGHTLIHGWIQGALAGGPPAYNTTAPGIRPLRAAAATGGGLASVADAEKQLLAELEALAAAAAAA